MPETKWRREQSPMLPSCDLPDYLKYRRCTPGWTSSSGSTAVITLIPDAMCSRCLYNKVGKFNYVKGKSPSGASIRAMTANSCTDTQPAVQVWQISHTVWCCGRGAYLRFLIDWILSRSSRASRFDSPAAVNSSSSAEKLLKYDVSRRSSGPEKLTASSW